MCIQSLFTQEDSHWCWLTPAGKHCAILVTKKKKKKFAFDEIQNTQIHKLHETLLMPITTWAFQLHKPLKCSKQGNANTPASRMLIYILGAMQEQTYPDLLIESCGTCWHVLKMKGKKHVH